MPKRDPSSVVRKSERRYIQDPSSVVRPSEVKKTRKPVRQKRGK
jgi:hypothetical protein